MDRERETWREKDRHTDGEREKKGERREGVGGIERGRQIDSARRREIESK